MNIYSIFYHYVGKIVSIQDSIITCDERYSNCFIGELVSVNHYINYTFRGINTKKKFLLNCDQKYIYINDFIYGLRETIKIKSPLRVSFHLFFSRFIPFFFSDNNKKKISFKNN